MIKKTIIRDIAGVTPYLLRWSVALPFGLSVKLHQIVRADDDRCAHDHPWWMLRIILWGGYIEEHGPGHNQAHIKPWRPWAPWRLYWCGAKFRHRILRLPSGSSWTLALMGGKRREWGFYTRAGWVAWRKFVNESSTARIMWCDDNASVSKTETREHQ